MEFKHYAEAPRNVQEAIIAARASPLVGQTTARSDALSPTD